MPVSSTEIIARLQLQGSQFSAETQRIFGAMEAQSRDAASRVKSVFEESFTNIQSIAGKALAMPRMKGGSFDLDVKGAREAAAALDAEAAALRQVAAAAEAVALKQNDLSENTRVYLQAARAAAIEAENMARSAHQEAAALDLLQQELMQTQSATELVIQSNRLLNASQDQGVRAARGHGMAMMQAGQQAQDFIIQVGAGQSVIMAFAMQASQAAFVLQGVGGQAGKLAAFMSSGWGTAVLAGITVLSLFWDKMIDTGDAVEKATAELRKNAQQTLVTEEAQKRFANTAEGVADAIRKQRDEQERAGKTMEEAEEQALRSAEAERVKQIEIRKGTLALLEMAKAAAMNARITTYGAGGGASANQARQQMDDTVAELERRAAAAQKAVELAEKTVRGAQRPIIDRRVEETMDAEAAAAGRLRRALRELEQQYDRGGMSKDRYEARRTKLQADHDAEVKRIQEAEARKRREDRAAERQAERTMQLMSPVDGPISSGYGQRSRPRLTNGGRGSANHPALDYAVPTGTGVRAGAAGIVVYTGQMGGYGNVVIVDYGRGTFGQFAHLSEILAKPGDKVAAGDVVARTGATGNVTGAHLDYRVRTGARFDGERLVGGQYVDPRSRVKVGDIGDAQANFDDQRARQIEDQREALQKLITASEQQLSVEAESLRFLGLRVRGMDELATAETEIAQKRRDYAQQMADLSAAD
ncbi:MAG TPA: peptidoglycan DD-metalloendopeptidase family protein, partial [Sphingomonas sp.]|nr:peptidoglycan DD-metalloendopeptidase family protein [Sphingomonas sp.]